jgi:hypothetical protein
VPTIVTFTPLQPPQRTSVSGTGRLMPHECRDAAGQKHRQRIPLGSVRGIFYLDGLCLHCGAHFIWVETRPGLADYEDSRRRQRRR